jgi:hypothetical protein
MKTVVLGYRFMVKTDSSGQQKNLKEIAKQLVTPEMQRRDSKPHISCEFRGGIRRVPGVKESYPHAAEDKVYIGKVLRQMKTINLGKRFMIKTGSSGQRKNFKDIAKQLVTPDMQRRDYNLISAVSSGAAFEESWRSKSHIHTQPRRNFRREKLVVCVIQKGRRKEQDLGFLRRRV